MSNMSPIALTKVASGSGLQTAQALSGSSSGMFANVGGLNFMDFLIARLTGGEENEAEKNTEAKSGGEEVKEAKELPTEGKDINALQKNNPLTLLQIALATQTTDENGNIVLGNVEQQAKKLEAQLGLTNQIINHLKNVLPENPDNNTIFQKLLTRLQNKSESLQASLDTLESGVITKDTAVEDIPLPLLILFGLNPSEITQVTDKVQSLEEKLGREITVEDMIAGVGGILPPPETSALAALNVQPPRVETLPSDAEPTDDMAAQLNAMDVGAGDKKDLGPAGKLDKDADFDALSKEALQAKDKSDAKHIAPQAKDVPAKAPATTGAQNALDTGFSAAWASSDIEQALGQQFGVQATSTLSLGSVAQSANVIATSATAGQPHPATNMVAAYISKFSNPNNGDQTMTLRLDPPELGNVAIRLKFGRDNSVKAHLTIEKPETYMMLQRDALTLEKTLQQSGFDTNSSSISFELANQGDNPFNNNGEGGGEKNFGNGGNGNGQNALSGDEITQSSVTWQVDPDSGHVRYNLYV